MWPPVRYRQVRDERLSEAEASLASVGIVAIEASEAERFAPAPEGGWKYPHLVRALSLEPSPGHFSIIKCGADLVVTYGLISEPHAALLATRAAFVVDVPDKPRRLFVQYGQIVE